ncbi:MAG: DegT/DnrJ/EryC1/StrS family aminotransferase [Clostridiales bacterium]|nr:DegT/DnrJ/EryC1/StrS family aminotransferase [Clostridiales bacterium]
MEQNIPFLDLAHLNAPFMKEIEEAVKRVISSGRYIGGPEIAAFEHDLANYQKVRNVVGVSNGLDALRLIMRGYIEMGIMKPGDEVIVPANTYIASLLAISDVGLTPVPVEPSVDTLNLDTSLIEKAITPLTRAVMVVHLYGRTCWDDRLASIARDRGLIIIEDNAQGIGSQATTTGHGGNRLTGSLGHAAAFSFYPTKNLGAMGDAGAVATNDDDLAHTVRSLSNYGSSSRYHNDYKGYNCRIDPIQAAVLRVKLPYLDSNNDRRRHIAEMYNRLVDNQAIRLCIPAQLSTTNFHQLVALSEHRDSLREHLAMHGIGTDIHYATPPHRQPCYAAQLGHMSLPVTEWLSDRVVSLPIAPYLSDDQIIQICQALNAWH